MSRAGGGERPGADLMEAPRTVPLPLALEGITVAALAEAMQVRAAIMEPLRRLIRGLVVASAAILAVLAAGAPALAAPTPTPTASATDGAGNTGTFDGTTGKSDGASNPTLQLSKNQAAPDETITVAGDGYTQCTKPDTQETWVRLLGDGNQIADVTGSVGSFR